MKQNRHPKKTPPPPKRPEDDDEKRKKKRTFAGNLGRKNAKTGGKKRRNKNPSTSLLKEALADGNIDAEETGKIDNVIIDY